MKKILCAVLCMAMLLSVAILPVGAVDLSADTFSYADNTSLKMEAPLHANHPVYLPFGQQISENSTVTVYMMLDSSTVSAQNSFPLYLVSQYYSAETTATATKDNSLLTGIGWEMWGTTGRTINTSLDASDKSSGKKLVDGQFNRIDMAIDFENKQMTAYLNYELVGTVDFVNSELTYYSGLYIPYIRTLVKYAYFDNLMVTKGCNVPEKGDVASNLSPADVAEQKASIIYFDTFDDASKITSAVGNTAHSIVCKRQNFQGYLNEISATVGLQAQEGGAQFRGVQKSEATDGKYNIRLVGTTDSLNYKKVGFRIALEGGKTKDDWAEYVYDAIIGSNGIDETVTYSALGTYGAGYIYASIINGLSATESYTFTVTPLTVDGEGNLTEHAPYTVSCVNGEVTVSAVN